VIELDLYLGDARPRRDQAGEGGLSEGKSRPVVLLGGGSGR
jgi:hypothetical protein